MRERQCRLSNDTFHLHDNLNFHTACKVKQLYARGVTTKAPVNDS